MAKLYKQFKTNYSALEMKNYISTKLLPNPTLASFLESTYWEGDTLFINSKLGKGKIILENNLITIDFVFSFLGSVAQKTIEATLDKEFKQLGK
ncbi:MAG: polyhydroxyalkanoic acid system family protein [Ignavibacteria bacterium]|nr:polyhydroxyalkanoic acid system family protein [Ignavibacteria bacterium]